MTPQTNAATATVEREFTIERVLNAPRDLMWKAWSEPERLAQWWGPKGCKLEVRKLEFKPGGIFHYGMQMRPGMWWGRFIYREIEKPQRIVFVSSFSDEAGGITRAPFSSTWPLEVLNNLTLTEENGKTTVDASAEERADFEGMFGSMQQGFGGTFDQLEEYLAKA